MVKLNRRLWKRFIAIAKPYWVSDERWIAWGLLGLLVVFLLAYTEFSVLFNRQLGEFSSALAAQDSDRFWGGIRFFILLLVFAVPINSFYYLVRDKLAIYWRRWMTHKFLGDYFSNRAYYDIAVILVGMPVLVAFAAGASVTGVGARVFGILGMLSYGVYVTHGPIVAIYNYAAMHVKFHIPGVVMVLLASITAATLAWVADSRYDAPFRRWLTERIPFSKSGASDPEAG